MRTLSSPVVLAVLTVFFFSAAACDDGSSPSPSPSPVPSPSSPGGSSGGSSGEIPNTCAPQTGPGVTHSGDIQGDATWTAADSPHVITANVNVRGGAKLTIEPCAVVQIAKGAYINVAQPITPNSGTLIAEGKADRPIRFEGKDGARWASVSVRAPGTARFAHVTFEGGGGGDFQNGATLAVYGDGEDGADPILSVDHVRIEGSLGTGAWLQRGAAFAAGSTALTITGSGTGAGADHSPFPLEIEEHTLDTLPDGSYTGNEVDEILLAPAGGKMAGSGLLADATMHDRGVPYRVGRSKQHSLTIGGRPDGKLVTLTIEAGTRLRFTEGSALNVQKLTNLEPSTAALRVLGTADKPVVFTSASSAPKPGDWRGLWFGGIPDPSNHVDHLRIEYAGYDCGCILNTCSAIAEHEGAVIFTAQPPSAFITNTVFANIAGHGITQGFDGAFIDLRPTNAFEGVSGCAQTRPRSVDTSCPSPRPACE